MVTQRTHHGKRQADKGPQSESSSDGMCVCPAAAVKVPETSWLKTTRMYYRIDLEVRVQTHSPWAKVRVLRGCAPVRVSGEDPTSCLYQLLRPAHIPWLMATASILKPAA